MSFDAAIDSFSTNDVVLDSVVAGGPELLESAEDAKKFTEMLAETSGSASGNSFSADIEEQLLADGQFDFEVNGESYTIGYNRDTEKFEAYNSDGDVIDSNVQINNDNTVEGFIEVGGIDGIDSGNRLYIGQDASGEVVQIEATAELDLDDEIGAAGSHLATLTSEGIYIVGAPVVDAADATEAAASGVESTTAESSVSTKSVERPSETKTEVEPSDNDRDVGGSRSAGSFGDIDFSELRLSSRGDNHEINPSGSDYVALTVSHGNDNTDGYANKHVERLTESLTNGELVGIRGDDDKAIILIKVNDTSKSVEFSSTAPSIQVAGIDTNGRDLEISSGGEGDVRDERIGGALDGNEFFISGSDRSSSQGVSLFSGDDTINFWNTEDKFEERGAWATLRIV